MPQLTSEFSNHPDYIEAKNGSGYVYFGTRKSRPQKGIPYNESLEPFYADINLQGENWGSFRYAVKSNDLFLKFI